MSKNIGTFKGKIEVISKRTTEPVYQDVNMYLTVFAGGAERGRSLQISLDSGNYIQLDNKTAKKLAELLSDWENAPEVD